MNDILSNIIALRKKLGLSQDNIADALEISQGGYNSIEKGNRELKYSTLVKIAKVMDKSVINIIAFPEELVTRSSLHKEEEVEAVLQIKLKSDKKKEILKIVFGDNNLEFI